MHGTQARKLVAYLDKVLEAPERCDRKIETLRERKIHHISFDDVRAGADVRGLAMELLATLCEHAVGKVEPDDVVLGTRDWNEQSSGTAAKLEDRSARIGCQVQIKGLVGAVHICRNEVVILRDKLSLIVATGE